MNHFYKKMITLFMVGYALAMPMIASATLIPFTEPNCSNLANPKTVLLVHATWCSHCKKFLPVYEKVSNEDKYKDWTFYNIIADDLWRVCGKQIDGYPYTYKNNMKTVLKGNRSQKALENFLDAT